MTSLVQKVTRFEWNESRTNAAIALAEGKSQNDAATIAGVSLSTIKNWLHHPDFIEEVDRLSFMVGVALRAERLRIIHRVIRQMIKDDGTIITTKDVLDWLKYAQSETQGAKLDLATLVDNATSVADSGSGGTTTTPASTNANERETSG